jgi:cobalt-precorrin 5A hydrolase
MKIAVCALTKNGAVTAAELGELLEADVYLKQPWAGSCDKVKVFSCSLKELIDSIYQQYDGFVMIMACGIVVRTFAPLLKSKDQDPAVVVMDEKEQFAISLLSGHLGGANTLTEKIAAITGAVAVITTATDVNEKMAFDLFAKVNDCTIENLSVLKYISGALVNGMNVFVYSDFPIDGALPQGICRYRGGIPEYLVVISDRKETPVGEHTLYLRPRCLYLGCGCKKNTDTVKMKAAAADFMEKSGYSMLSLKALSSIDLKKEESCILDLSNEMELPFITFNAKALQRVEVAEGSAFVEQTTGVKSVSEAAAKLASGGETLIGKTVYEGITLSLAKKEVVLTWSTTEKENE